MQLPSPSLKHLRMIGTEDGFVYSMFTGNGDSPSSARQYFWRTKWFSYFPDAGISVIKNIDKLNPGKFTIGLNNVPTSRPTHATNGSGDFNYCVWDEMSNQESSLDTDDFGQYYLPMNMGISSMGVASNVKVNDMVEHYNASSATPVYVPMVATNNGCLGIDSTSPAGPSGNIRLLCVLPDAIDASNERVFVATENKLYRYYSKLAADKRWKEVNNYDEHAQSIPGVTSMVSLNSGVATYALVANVVLGQWKVGLAQWITSPDVEPTDPWEGILFTDGTWDGRPIKAMKIVKTGATVYCYFATNDGVYYRKLKDEVLTETLVTSCPPVKLSPLLDGINVLKIIDYDGKIGLLTEHDGFIVGPYPPVKWN